MENIKNRASGYFQQTAQSKRDRTDLKQGGLPSLAGNDAFMVDLAIDFDNNSSYPQHVERVKQTQDVADVDLEEENRRELLHRTSTAREGEVQPIQSKTQDVRGTKLRESLRDILPRWRRRDGKGLLRRRSGQSTAQSPEPGGVAFKPTLRQSPPLVNAPNTNNRETTCHAAGTGSTCLHLTVWLLEDLVSWCDSVETASVDNLLSNFRNSISVCSRITECERCGGGDGGSASDNNTILLVTAARYMSTICGRIVHLYVDMHATYMQSQHDSGYPQPPSPSEIFYRPAARDYKSKRSPAEETQREGSDSSSTQEQDVRFSSYHISSRLERLHVLKSIIVVQMTDFARFLEQLKVKENHRKGNLTFLIEALDTTSKAEESLKRCVSDDSGW